MLAQARQEGVALARLGANFDDQSDCGHGICLLREILRGGTDARGKHRIASIDTG